ncbi:hypothetical protein [Larkinella rosea]|uniref:Uncharacterized protein n=1 Tax=Larkinella rosea TaxID=2025312 RepID=A0A3P1C3V1_9BACT|nr:hypothetical protein [Larkinella rosea]RRB07454.1 hypothetical protein EHT25_06645 [Larkinella rosea]
MKTSNMLVIALFITGLLTLIGANVALKAEYDKIDFNDPFSGLSSITLKPFRILKLEGNLNGLVSVETGKTSEIRLQEDVKSQFTFRSSGDTLVVLYKPESSPWQSRPNQYINAVPAATILTPSLHTLITDKVSCNLNRLTTENLTINQQNAGVLLTNSTIGTLTVTDSRGSELHTKPTNRIRNAVIFSRDSSNITVERNIFDSFALEYDSLTKLKIPGSLLKKIK